MQFIFILYNFTSSTTWQLFFSIFWYLYFEFRKKSQIPYIKSISRVHCSIMSQGFELLSYQLVKSNHCSNNKRGFFFNIKENIFLFASSRPLIWKSVNLCHIINHLVKLNTILKTLWRKFGNFNPKSPFLVAATDNFNAK